MQTSKMFIVNSNPIDSLRTINEETFTLQSNEDAFIKLILVQHTKTALYVPSYLVYYRKDLSNFIE